MLEDAGRGVVARQQDIRKRLVVPKQYVKSRPQALDEIRFEQQRLGLGPGDDKLHRRRFPHHAADAAGVEPALRVVGHALLQVARLADIEHVAGGVDHPIDAGRVGQPPRQGVDQFRPELAVRVSRLRVPLDAGEGQGRSGRRHHLRNDLLGRGVVVVILVAGRIAGNVVVGDRAWDAASSVRHGAMPVTSGGPQARVPSHGHRSYRGSGAKIQRRRSGLWRHCGAQRPPPFPWTFRSFDAGELASPGSLASQRFPGVPETSPVTAVAQAQRHSSVPLGSGNLPSSGALRPHFCTTFGTRRTRRRSCLPSNGTHRVGTKKTVPHLMFRGQGVEE